MYAAATSRGVVRLASARPNDPLILDGNYLGTDQDLKALMKAIDVARELGRQTAFDGLRDAELIPGPAAGAQEIEELARLGSASFGHAVGTCKIGVDEMAVGDHSDHPVCWAWQRLQRGRPAECWRYRDRNSLQRLPWWPNRQIDCQQPSAP